jgi:hypothetical protein
MTRLLLLLAGAALALAGCVDDGEESTATGDEGPGSSGDDTAASPPTGETCPFGQGTSQVCPTSGAPDAAANGS